MKRKAKTTTAQAKKPALTDDILNPPDFHAPAATDPASPPELRQAGKSRTRQKASSVKMPSGAAAKLAAIHATGAKDSISDAEAARRASVETPGAAVEPTAIPVDPAENVDPETLPAVVNKDIAAATAVEPEWHQVRHLPGYLRSPIRALGRAVFRTFTDTSIEKIQVLANLGNKGPNSEREIEAAAAWLKKFGVKDKELAMNFQRSIPGYSADTVVSRARGYTFLLVKDFAGRYVYAWPSGDEIAHVAVRHIAERSGPR